MGDDLPDFLAILLLVAVIRGVNSAAADDVVIMLIQPLWVHGV